MSITHLDLALVYQESDVVSAQRLRFRHSSRLKLLAGIGALALLIPLAQLIVPGVFGAGANLPLLAGIGALFLLVPALTYLLGPFIDYRRNAFWHSPLELGLSPAGLRLALAGSEPGQPAMELPWPELHHVVENDEVMILFFGGEQSFIIIPCRLFTAPGAAAFVRDLLDKALAAEPEQEDEAGA